LLLIGACSLGTVVSTSIAALLVTRILGGFGLGGAMPNFITLASEAVASARRQKLVTLLMGALPAGGLIASVTSLANGIGWGWRTIFVVGGIVTLGTGILSIWGVSDTEPSRLEARSSLSEEPRAPSDTPPRPERLLRILFGEGRA